MKKIFFIAIMSLAIYPAIAQDTIDFPPRHYGDYYAPVNFYPFNYRYSTFDYNRFPERRNTLMGLWPRVVPHGQSQYIYGVSFSIEQMYKYSHGILPHFDSIDTMTIFPVVIDKEGTSYFVYRTDTLDCRQMRYYDDGSRVRIHLHPPCDSTLRDSLVTLYKAYFDSPLPVQDTFYIGYYANCYTPHSFHIKDGTHNITLICGTFLCPSLPYAGWDSFLEHEVAFTEDYKDSTISYIGPIGNSYLSPIIFPILTPPDTHLFSCPAMELAYAGIVNDNPTLMWDTAFEHNLYQIAYGPYDLPVESLHTDTTSRHDYEIPSSTLSPTVYYQARVRAYCRHICHFHDTAAWTPWSDPVYFYTGSSMPDTTHSQPGGIAPIAAGPAFSLVPNPATQGRVPTVAVDPSLLATAPLLTLRDLAGRELLRTTLRQPVTPLPADLAAGTYLVTLATPQGSTTHRLVVE